MEFKHFSHTHGLIFHQMPQGTEIRCSGCNSPGSGSVYVCWPCNYFLHEQCFKAGRSINYPSHPSHPLTLVPYPTYPSSSFFCNSCNMLGNGFSYTCAHCEFDLHVQCATTPTITTTTPPRHEPYPNNPHQNHSIPNQTAVPKPNYLSHNQTASSGINAQVGVPSAGPPLQEANPSATFSQTVGGPTQHQLRGTKHFSHNHALFLSKVQEKDAKICSGCEKDLVGWAYKCGESPSPCNFYLHQSCFRLPQKIRHESHLDHSLTLVTKAPYEGDNFICSACNKYGSAFVYNCSACEFDLHIDCASLPETVVREDHEHRLALYYSSPLKEQQEELRKQNLAMTFECDVCLQTVHENCWLYYCEKCDFGTHLECVNSKVGESEKSEETANAFLESQLELERLKLLMLLRRRNSRFDLTR